jgi:hypothetical protein
VHCNDVECSHSTFHSINDMVCRTQYTPDVVELVNDGQKRLFASPMAENTNRWLGKLTGFLKSVDLLSFRFISMSLVDGRNREIIRRLRAKDDVCNRRQDDADVLADSIANMCARTI